MKSQSDIDDALIAQFLGRQYLGRRYLRYAELEALGLVDNRASLKNWMDVGAFPAGLKIPGPAGKTLVWMAIEIARHIAQRRAERDAFSGAGDAFRSLDPIPPKPTPAVTSFQKNEVGNQGPDLLKSDDSQPPARPAPATTWVTNVLPEFSTPRNYR